MRAAKWASVVLAAGCGLAYFALRSGKVDPVVFKTGKLDRGSVEQVVTATGQLNAVITVQVGSQVSGIVQKLFADFNSQVKEGQVIAIIDPTRIKAQLVSSEANLKEAQASAMRAKVNHDQAKREYGRAKELQDKNVIGSAEVEELQSRLELAAVEVLSSDARVAQARASVSTTRVDLERTVIKAPITGTVLQRAVDVGQTVAASMSAPTLFTIAQDLAKMEVRAAIDEADVGKLKEGLDARFTVDAHPGREFVATIHQLRSNPNVSQNVVTYDAILRVDNPDGKLRPGMTANVRFVTERRDDVLRIPNTALRFKPPAEMVLESKDGPGAGGIMAMRRSRGDGGTAFGERGERGERGGGMRGPGGGGPGSGFAGGGLGGPGGGAAFGGVSGRRGGGGVGGRRAGGSGGGGEGGGRIIARVYKAQGEKVVAVPFRPGIADDQYTEVLFGPLSAGDEIVIEATGGVVEQQQQRPASSSSPFGRGGSSRGPRMF